MTSLAIPSAFTTTFTLEYGVSEADMRRLYENAKRDQWNASKDIPWSDAPSPDGRVIADELIDVYGSPLWDRLPEADRVALNRRIAAWRLSVLMHGEQGALLACSQMVDIVQGADQKFFQATQVVDEARHNEVLSRYLTDRLDGLTYPMPANERDLFDSILSESRWYLKTISLQLVAETFAVALFKMMSESARDPVLGTICKRILQDESRHMGFGMLSLPDVVGEMTDAERKELEEFTHWALVRTLTGQFPEPVFRELGFDDKDIKTIHAHRRERAAGAEGSHFRKLFRKDLHGTLLANLQKVGLLTDRMRPALESVGIRMPA